MEITETFYKDEDGILCGLEITINGEKAFSFFDCSDCPEDATISRAMNDAVNIVAVLKTAYEEGKAGKFFSVTQKTEEY